MANASLSRAGVTYEASRPPGKTAYPNRNPSRPTRAASPVRAGQSAGRVRREEIRNPARPSAPARRGSSLQRGQGQLPSRSSLAPDRAAQRIKRERQLQRSRRPMEDPRTQTRRPQSAPARKKPAPRKSGYVRPWERVRAAQQARVNPMARKNQRRAFQLNAVMVVVLMIAMFALLGVTIQFLQIKSEYTTSLENVAEKEALLSDLKKENEDYLNTLNTNVDLSELKRTAVSRLGMNVPTEDQVDSYTTSEGSGYLRQYLDISEE